jgi:inner membrane protein YidH
MLPMRERRPSWVYMAGDEPDPRFSLANERTFLAWVRTALAMVAGGIALHSLGIPASEALRSIVVVVLLLMGGLTCAVAGLRWARVERAMRTRSPLPAFSLGLALVVTLFALSMLLAVAVAVD